MEDMFECEECGSIIVDAPAHAVTWESRPALQCLVCGAIYADGNLVSGYSLDEAGRQAAALDAAYYREMEG